jgi:hypothetical protein
MAKENESFCLPFDSITFSHFETLENQCIASRLHYLIQLMRGIATYLNCGYRKSGNI